jgi:hypothetical protein
VMPPAEIGQHAEQHRRGARHSDARGVGVHRHGDARPGSMRNQRQPSGAGGLRKPKVGVWGGTAPDGAYRDVLQPFTPEVMVTMRFLSPQGMSR